jgi:hypothetical protein
MQFSALRNPDEPRQSLPMLTKLKPGEPSICDRCSAFVIFTDELMLRQLDWPDWCLGHG